jgi:peptidoglycan/xylan/chitin deacetylase (PgdA/CDA1 family)
MSATTRTHRAGEASDTMLSVAAPVVPVLLYHDIADGSAHERFRRFVVPPALLDEHLSALKSAGYQTANASALVSDQLEPSDGARVVYLTFDDGFSSFADYAVPAMTRYGMTGTVFVPTAFVGGPAAWLASMGEDRRTLMTWAELRAVSAAGMEVGAHGHRHLQCDLVRRDLMRAELHNGRATLEEHLSVSITSMAYPFGWHDRSVRAAARATGYQVAFEVGDNVHRGPSPTPLSDNVLRVRRLVIDTNVSGDDLLRLIEHGRRGSTAQRMRCMVRPAWRVVRQFSASGRQSRHG